MTRLLAPYALPLIGGLAVALLAAIGWIYIQGQWLDQAEAERDAAISYIQGRQETDNALDDLPDDPDAILDGLRACADGGACFGNP